MFGWLQAVKQFKVVRRVIQAAEDWYADKPFELGAALAYYAVFSIAPVILIALAVASLFLGRHAAEGHINQELESLVGPTVAHALAASLKYTHKTGSGATATLVSAVVLLLSAMGLFGQLQSALNTIWRAEPKPGGGLVRALWARFWSFLAVLGAAALLLASLLANMAISALSQLVSPAAIPGSLYFWRTLTLGVSFLLLSVATALIFRLLPDVTMRWKPVWVGAVVTALLLILGNYLISLYLKWSGVTSTYGAAGSLVVILLWVYYSAQALLFGAEFTQVYAKSTGDPIRPAEGAQPAMARPRGGEDQRSIT